MHLRAGDDLFKVCASSKRKLLKLAEASCLSSYIPHTWQPTGGTSAQTCLSGSPLPWVTQAVPAWPEWELADITTSI